MARANDKPRKPRILRAGTVAIVGRSNVGKSTLLNTALEHPLAVVSRLPQTTRTALLGIVRHGEAELGFLDTPGLHKARTRLGREMNRAAHDAVRNADVIVFVVAIPRTPKGELAPHPGDVALVQKLPSDKPVVLVVNKVDVIRDKRALLPLMRGYSELRELGAIVPVSALSRDGVSRVLDEVAKLLPEGEARFAEDALTDRPTRHFASEYVREAILRATAEEVPHAVAVAIDDYVEPASAGKVTRIAATIHVERDGQKRIIIGQKGAMLKRIGSEARLRIEELIGARVHLELWVKVTPEWRDRPELLSDFGLLARAKVP
jgi:GTP-binding protein Era